MRSFFVSGAMLRVEALGGGIDRGRVDDGWYGERLRVGIAIDETGRGDQTRPRLGQRPSEGRERGVLVLRPAVVVAVALGEIVLARLVNVADEDAMVRLLSQPRQSTYREVPALRGSCRDGPTGPRGGPPRLRSVTARFERARMMGRCTPILFVGDLAGPGVKRTRFDGVRS